MWAGLSSPCSLRALHSAWNLVVKCMLNKQVTGRDILCLTSPWQLLAFSLPPTNSATFVIKNSPCEKFQRIVDIPKTSLWKAGWPTAGADLPSYFTSQTPHCPSRGTITPCSASQPGSPHAAIWGHYFIYPLGSLQPRLPNTTLFLPTNKKPKALPQTLTIGKKSNNWAWKIKIIYL